jgi:hypothetical protein
MNNFLDNIDQFTYIIIVHILLSLKKIDYFSVYNITTILKMTTVYLTHVKSYQNRNRDNIYISKSLNNAIDWCINGLLCDKFEGFLFEDDDDKYDYFSVKNEEEFIEFIKYELTNSKYLSNDYGSIDITEKKLHD